MTYTGSTPWRGHEQLGKLQETNNWFIGSYIRLIDQLLLLRFLALLSMLFPLVLIGGTVALDHCTTVLESLSHYYYTTMGWVFVGVLYITGLILFLYKGATPAENIAARFAAICIVGVALLPTSRDIYGCCNYAYHPNELGELLHKAFAAFFFLTMSALFYLFTRNSNTLNQQVRNRNRLYRLCAGMIWVIAGIMVALLKPAWLTPKAQLLLLDWTMAYKPILWLEWLALVDVGTAWLIKSGCLLADPVPQTAPGWKPS
jgi:hypothetical protein